MKKSILLVLFTICSTLCVSAQNEVKIDTSKSLVKWTGSNLFKFNKHFGTVKFKDGNFIKTESKITGGEFTIDMNTIINTDGKYNEMLIWHLKNQDFFDVEKHPFSYLKIKTVTYQSEKEINIKADLTIKEITKTIDFSATIKNNQMISKFIIDRTLWNINYESKGILGSIKDDIISDAIEFEVILNTTK